MKVIKKFTAIQIGTHTINDKVAIDLCYGDIDGPYYDKEYPEEEFDTEDEAIKYAYNKSEFSKWLIVPIIKFNYL